MVLSSQKDERNDIDSMAPKGTCVLGCQPLTRGQGSGQSQKFEQKWGICSDGIYLQ